MTITYNPTPAFDELMAAFATLAALFLVGVILDLHVHRRGPYRDRSAVLLIIAFVAIVVMGVFAQVGVSA